MIRIGYKSVTYGPLLPLFTKQRIYVYDPITKHLCVVPLYKNMVCKILVKWLNCSPRSYRISIILYINILYYVPHYTRTRCGIIIHW